MTATDAAGEGLHEQLSRLSAEATQGEWRIGQIALGQTHVVDMGVPPEPCTFLALHEGRAGDPRIPMIGQPDFGVVHTDSPVRGRSRANAQFIATLVNAYRAGELAPASALEPADLAPDVAALDVEAAKAALDEFRQRGGKTMDELEAAPDVAALREALSLIAERHIPDQPASSPLDEDVYLRRQYAELRRMAGAALAALETKP